MKAIVFGATTSARNLYEEIRKSMISLLSVIMMRKNGGGV